jgi:hypothetical protein
MQTSRPPKNKVEKRLNKLRVNRDGINMAEEERQRYLAFLLELLKLAHFGLRGQFD